MDIAQNKMGWLPPAVIARLEKLLNKIPAVQREIEAQYAPIMAELEDSARPYRDQFKVHARLPAKGVARNSVLREMQQLRKTETERWQKGLVSGAVYHGNKAHHDFLNQVYAINSQTNPLHSDLWPSAAKFESEIISMTAGMLGADLADCHAANPDICGSVTSGGTESILCAMKAYRDRARAERGIKRPQMITPITAHVAFEKAAEYFHIKKINVPVDKDGRADLRAVRRAITRNTIVIVGSAPGFPHGVVDPIEQMSELARQKNIGFHTDACLGGFILPWGRELGYDVPDFDFRLPGVTSISADTHKFGYASKGTSVVLYRGNALRRYQYFASTDWPGGMYCSPTMAGSKSGALIAVSWAALVSLGRKGYLDYAAKIFKTTQKIALGIEKIKDLKLIGDSLFIITIASDSLDIYRVLDQMSKHGWNLNGLHKPAAMHFCITVSHSAPGVSTRFLADLKRAVAFVKTHPAESGGMAPVYGMAATMPMRGLVKELLARYMDLLTRV